MIRAGWNYLVTGSRRNHQLAKKYWYLWVPFYVLFMVKIAYEYMNDDPEEPVELSAEKREPPVMKAAD